MSTPAYRLLNNSRFYILVFSLLLAVFVFALLRILIPGDQLFYIRLQQVYGLIGILYWYGALVISPIGYVIGKDRVKRIAFARRAVGVSAFFFAFLHSVIALTGQLGGIDQVMYLPSLFQWSLVGGFIALCILFVMAATSFDIVVKRMTFRWWKWLHRCIYIGGVLVILHIWTIGTHLAYGGVQLAAFIALVLLVGLELIRVMTNLNQKLHLAKSEIVTLYIASWVIVSTLVLMIPAVVENYHSRHMTHETQQSAQGGRH